jgi:hypothetical protein
MLLPASAKSLIRPLVAWSMWPCWNNHTLKRIQCASILNEPCSTGVGSVPTLVVAVEVDSTVDVGAVVVVSTGVVVVVVVGAVAGDVEFACLPRRM